MRQCCGSSDTNAVFTEATSAGPNEAHLSLLLGIEESSVVLVVHDGDSSGSREVCAHVCAKWK